MAISAKIGQYLRPFIGNGDVSSQMKNSWVGCKTPNKQTNISRTSGSISNKLNDFTIKTIKFIKRRCFFSLFMPRRSKILSFCPPLTFEQWVLELWYSNEYSLWQDLSCGYHYFLPCDLDLGFDLFFDNFNLANNFWTVSARSLIFQMSDSWDKTFPWVPSFFNLWPWSLTHF